MTQKKQVDKALSISLFSRTPALSEDIRKTRDKVHHRLTVAHEHYNWLAHYVLYENPYYKFTPSLRERIRQATDVEVQKAYKADATTGEHARDLKNKMDRSHPLSKAHREYYDEFNLTQTNLYLTEAIAYEKACDIMIKMSGIEPPWLK